MPVADDEPPAPPAPVAAVAVALACAASGVPLAGAEQPAPRATSQHTVETIKKSCQRVANELRTMPRSYQRVRRAGARFVSNRRAAIYHPRAMADDDVVWFPSKVDGWLWPVLCLPPASAVLFAIMAVLSGRPETAMVPAVLVVGIYGGLVFPMRYGIGASELVIRFGLVRQRVPLAKITRVRPTRNPLSAPALSLDRLEIRWGEGLFGSTRISPADREGFLTLLAERSGLTREGDSLHVA
jgi:hypothetical protein